MLDNADLDDLPTLVQRVAIAGWEAGQLPDLINLQTAATAAPATVPAPVVAEASPPVAAKPVSVVRRKPANPAGARIVAAVAQAG